jgi:holo-[acyl-carrier protein] synthase
MDGTMILGTGIDIIEVARIKESILRTKSFKERVFSKSEVEYCESAVADIAFQRFAARFAAKEAFLKACGTGLREGYNMNEITIIRNVAGKPSIELSGKSRTTFNETIGGNVHLSLTHTEAIAQALVIIEKP